MGKEQGDEVTVQLPSGNKEFEIVSVEPAEIAPPDAPAGDHQR